ncbi:hypothetical protein [Actinacidiphila acidipaludis]|uniref:Uncharacterized protein n=1 Tax=Actinacidiphila acidipaludis TaxID=2873382 RepID=A0ABS7QC92_9ACTN|nr:hypothetical protein [Streptomyces acidipaludis]MBY8880790.1 hypothetical protein [Streptomyces acidipaludis]
MGDLVVTEADMQALCGALATALSDLEALRASLQRMDVSCVGAAPLTEAERTFTSTRSGDLMRLGAGISDRHTEAEQVVPTLRGTDHRIADSAQRRAD